MNFSASFFQSLFIGMQAPDAVKFFSSITSARETQERLLHSYIRNNQETQFGKEHGFRHIHDIAAYRRRVPVRRYQEFEPYLEQIQQGTQGVLTIEPVRYFLPTGGTTGTKLIPYTASLQGEFQRAVAPWLLDIVRHFPAILGGKTYWTITPPGKRLQRASDSRIPIGFEDDGAYFGWKGRLLRNIFAVPSWVTQVRRSENFRFLTLYFLLKEANLRWLSIWSPTFLLVLLEELDICAEAVLRSLHDGLLYLPAQESFSHSFSVRKAKKRAKRLEIALALSPEERYRRIWPNLTFISLWDAVYARNPAQQVQRYFPHAHCQGKGVLATEGVISLPLHQAGGCVPAITSHFLEFLHESGDVRSVWELERGEIYSVILTTGGGFYRYDIGDLVQVDGYYRGLPLLRFLGRKGRFADLAGEKLAESFVNTALEQTLDEFPFAHRFLLIAPEVSENGRRGYVAFLETSEPDDVINNFTQQLEEYFHNNIHYQIARDLKQIMPLRVVRVARDGQATYLRRCLDAGQKLGDIKPLTFDVRTGWTAWFR